MRIASGGAVGHEPAKQRGLEPIGSVPAPCSASGRSAGLDPQRITNNLLFARDAQCFRDDRSIIPALLFAEHIVELILFRLVSAEFSIPGHNKRLGFFDIRLIHRGQQFGPRFDRE